MQSIELSLSLRLKKGQFPYDLRRPAKLLHGRSSIMEFCPNPIRPIQYHDVEQGYRVWHAELTVRLPFASVDTASQLRASTIPQPHNLNPKPQGFRVQGITQFHNVQFHTPTDHNHIPQIHHPQRFSLSFSVPIEVCGRRMCALRVLKSEIRLLHASG